MTRKVAFIFLALTAAFVLTTSDALAERIRCKGGTCTGTQAADVISGTVLVDIISGLGGDDDIVGSLGNDIIYGGSGNDLIFGEEGDDELNGGPGHDRLFGNDGRDVFYGGADNDTIDAVFGQQFPQRDFVYCGTGYDTVTADRYDVVSSDCEKVTRV
jgi:Ca2+-binding RTX toxin-like protein